MLSKRGQPVIEPRLLYPNTQLVGKASTKAGVADERTYRYQYPAAERSTYSSAMRLATRLVSQLLRGNQSVFYCPQVVAEFYNVATRSVEANGLGFSATEAWREIEVFERILNLLPDVPEIYPVWKRLVREQRVRGLKVFDARLVAVAEVYGVKHILTFNAADFKSYKELAIVDPAGML